MEKPTPGSAPEEEVVEPSAGSVASASSTGPSGPPAKSVVGDPPLITKREWDFTENSLANFGDFICLLSEARPQGISEADTQLWEELCHSDPQPLWDLLSNKDESFAVCTKRLGDHLVSRLSPTVHIPKSSEGAEPVPEAVTLVCWAELCNKTALADLAWTTVKKIREGTQTSYYSVVKGGSSKKPTYTAKYGGSEFEVISLRPAVVLRQFVLVLGNARRAGFSEATRQLLNQIELQRAKRISFADCLQGGLVPRIPPAFETSGVVSDFDYYLKAIKSKPRWAK